MDQASLFDTEVASENKNALSKGDSKRAEDAAALTENAGRAAKEAELLSKEDVATAAKAPGTCAGCRTRRRASPLARLPRLSLLRARRAGNHRRRLRQAARRTATHRGKSSPTWSRPTATRSAWAATWASSSRPSPTWRACILWTTPWTWPSSTNGCSALKTR